MLGIKILDRSKFRMVDEVDLSMCSHRIHNGAFDGHMSIRLDNGQEIESTGHHYVGEWEYEYGFIVVEL